MARLQGRLGASPLKPETSENLTLGFTFDVGALSMTLDFYQIDIADTTYAISARDVSTDPDSGEAFLNFQRLEAAGVSGANSIGGVFYFANGFDTSTQGMDFVATYPVNWGDTGTTDLSLSLNWNKNEFDSDPSEFLNAEDTADFENFDPNWRSVFTASHNVGKLNLIGRLSYYGEYENNRSGVETQKFDGIWFTDLEAQYQINDVFKVSAGGRNVFDEYPEQDSIGDYCCGRIYSSGTNVDWQGSYYFARVTANF